jgi:hypothetical protein
MPAPNRQWLELFNPFALNEILFLDRLVLRGMWGRTFTLQGHYRSRLLVLELSFNEPQRLLTADVASSLSAPMTDSAAEVSCMVFVIILCLAGCYRQKVLNGLRFRWLRA